MNKLISLIRVLFKSEYTFNIGKSQSKIKSYIIKLLFILISIAFMILIGKAISNLYDILEVMNQEGLILELGIYISCFIVIFFSLFNIITIFCYSTDIEHLLPLPIKSYLLFISKLLIVLTYQYLIQAIILIPFITVYGFKCNAGFSYWIYSVLIYFFIPILPVIIISIIPIFAMQFIPFVKNKDLYKIFVGIFSIILTLGLQVFFKLSSEISLTQIIDLMNAKDNSFINLTKMFFPTTKLAIISLMNYDNSKGILALLIYLGVSIAILFLFILIGNKIYIKSITSLSEINSKKKHLSKKHYEKKIVLNSKFFSLIKREFTMLFRTPDYLMNCIFPIILYPIFIVTLIFRDGFDKIIFLLRFDLISEYIVLFGCCFILFQAGTSITSSTSISREGKEVYILKYIPVAYKTIIYSKLFTSFIIGLLPLVFMTITLIFLQCSFLTFLLFLIPSILATLFSTQLGLLIDINNPKLNWKSEQQAIKWNFNIILNTLFCFLLSCLLGYFLFNMHLSAVHYSLILTILFILFNIVIFRILINVFKKYNFNI